jgi:hypothetical protein
MLREDVERLIKEKSELEVLKNELRKWKADLDEKEHKLSNFNAYVKELEDKKNRIEAELKDLSQRYLTSLEEMLHKIDEEVNKIDRMFKLKEIRLERIARKERELSDALGYRARIRNHGHSCFLCEIVIRSQFHTTYEPEA